MIGRRPCTSFGNSAGARQMLEYTKAGEGRRPALLMLHDDATREYAYGQAERATRHQGWDVHLGVLRPAQSGRLDRHQHEERLEPHLRIRVTFGSRLGISRVRNVRFWRSSDRGSPRSHDERPSIVAVVVVASCPRRTTTGAPTAIGNPEPPRCHREFTAAWVGIPSPTWHIRQNCFLQGKSGYWGECRT
jgi:hypothetical protein